MIKYISLYLLIILLISIFASGFIHNKDGKYFPDPTNCKRFFSSSNGYTKPISCPDGTKFDSVKRTCEVEDTVDCQLNYGYYDFNNDQDD